MELTWQNTNQNFGFVLYTVIKITRVIFRCSRRNEMNHSKTKIQTSKSYSWRKNRGNFHGHIWSHLKEQFPHKHPTSTSWNIGSKLIQEKDDPVNYQYHLGKHKKCLQDLLPYYWILLVRSVPETVYVYLNF